MTRPGPTGESRRQVPTHIPARNLEVGQVAQAAKSAFGFGEDGPRDAVFSAYESICVQRSVKPKTSPSSPIPKSWRAGGEADLALEIEPLRAQITP